MYLGQNYINNNFWTIFSLEDDHFFSLLMLIYNETMLYNNTRSKKSRKTDFEFFF